MQRCSRERFAAFDGAGLIDQTRHPGMHETHSIDIICLLQGEASLISKSAKRDCGLATWLSSVGPTMPGTHMVARPYSWPF
jgi:hypothetical protein